MSKVKKVLILGGLGFIGKNLYQCLVKDNHEVTLLTNQIHQDVDGFIDEQVKSRIVFGSILDKDFITKTVKGYDVIFSLAGSSGAADSITNPYHDLDTNLRGHLTILEACRASNPNALLIFPSSRLVYGKPLANPVNENHPLHPESIYAIHKLTTEHYYQLYQRLYGVRCVIFRISNPFGPYQRFGSNHYGILNWFIHKAVHHQPIEIYGEGNQQRDFLYADDLSRLLSITMDKPAMVGNIYNVGLGKGIPLNYAVEVIKKYVPNTKVEYKPWPEIDKKIETGDYISDITRLKLDANWQPEVDFEHGVSMTIKFYEKQSK
jgi:nucleoside-diphosphate-sugar epimerase